MSSKYLRSTIVLGDSNTGKLKFGDGRGTFGHLIPGRRKEVLFIEGIDPLDCCGYKNIFIHCGINSIKHYAINTSERIDDYFNKFKEKINQIMLLCPDSKLFVSPILPTKREDWNARGRYFNRCLIDFKHATNNRFTILNFLEYVDTATGMLCKNMGSYWNPHDPIHLGSSGIRLLIGMVREHAFGSKVLTNKSFADALFGPSATGCKKDHGVARPAERGAVS